MRPRRLALGAWAVLAAIIALATPASGQTEEGSADAAKASQRVYPAEPDSAYVARLKRDADRAFERGNYERAFRLFRYGLAWRGDKYAQYMVGYMIFNGRGQRADRARGTAWLQLAAQRGDDAQLNAVYADALERLDDDQKRRSADVHERLVSDFGDRKVLRRLIRADRSALRSITGSRTGASDMLPLTIQLPNGQTVPGSVYYGAIKERIQRYEDYLGGKVTLGSFEVLDEAPVPEASQTDEENQDGGVDAEPEN